jgi:multiple sugar transport system permease protein
MQTLAERVDAPAPAGAPAGSTAPHAAKRRRLSEKRRSVVLRTLVGWVLGLIALFPVLWLILSALRPAGDTFAAGLPKRLTFDNLSYVLTEVPFPRYLLNSAIVSIVVTLAALLFHSMAAYALARLRFRGRDVVFTMMLSTMLVSMPVILVPLFLIIKAMGLQDSFGGLILPAIFNAFGIFLLRQYYLNIPHELEEAAELDGCGYPRIYWNVILPLSKPILASLAVLFFLANWNSFLWPLTITSSPSMDVIQLGISALQGQYSSSWNYILAASLLAAIPTVVAFIIGQRWLVDSFKTTGIK